MKKLFSLTLVLGLILVGCNNGEDSQDMFMEQQEMKPSDLKMVKVDIDGYSRSNAVGDKFKSSSDLQANVALLNEKLVEYGVQLTQMEYYSMDGSGQTVFFSDRGNKQLSSDYVPNDPRNALPGTSIPYLVDGTQLVTASGMNTLDPINTVMDTWNSVTCSKGLDIVGLGVTPFDIGFVSNFFFGFGGSDGFYPGIILQAGVLPRAFFDAIAPGGGSGILGVTFTLTWTEDINADGVGDVAIKEIYYNDAFNWQDVVTTGSGVDFETVALHETGHALSQAHFGKVSRTDSNGKIHFSPRAVMNAGYSGVNRVIGATDRAGHCSNWGNWPNN